MNIDIDSKSGKITFTVGEITININNESTDTSNYKTDKFPVKIVKRKEELFEDLMQEEYLKVLSNPPKSRTDCIGSILDTPEHEKWKRSEAEVLEKINNTIRDSKTGLLKVPKTVGENLDFSQKACKDDVKPFIEELEKLIKRNRYKTVLTEEWIKLNKQLEENSEQLNKLQELINSIIPTEPEIYEAPEESTYTNVSYITGCFTPSISG